MAQVTCTDVLVAQVLFPYLDVKIVGVSFDPDTGYLEWELEGPDVPDAEFVTASFSETLGALEPKRTVKCRLSADVAHRARGA